MGDALEDKVRPAQKLTLWELHLARAEVQLFELARVEALMVPDGLDLQTLVDLLHRPARHSDYFPLITSP